MEALVYKIKACNSAFEYVHNHFFEIEEIFVPELNFSFNATNFFEPEDARYKNYNPINKIDLDLRQFNILQDLKNMFSEYKKEVQCLLTTNKE